MLVSLTNRCFDGCSCCMNDCTPDGELMDWYVLEDLARFTDLASIRSIIIRGGEFTTDPEFDTKIKFMIVNCHTVHSMSLVSNGSWIEDPDVVRRIRKLLNQDRIFSLRIQSDERFNSSHDMVVSHLEDFSKLGRKVSMDLNWVNESNITKLGRAANLPMNSTSYPQCADLVVRCSNLGRIINKNPNDINLMDLFNLLESRGVFEVPMVDWRGNIHLGDSKYCSIVGSVSGLKSMNKMDKLAYSMSLARKLMTSTMCNNKCGKLYNLTMEQMDWFK